VQFEVEIAKRRGLWLGVKLVRGAYLVEETRLAKEGGYESPIVPTFELTTDNYLSNFKTVSSAGLQG
jgi:proline dehydrogenase